MSTEIVFERLDVALETTRGTLVTPPTHRLYMEGTMDPVMDYYEDETGVGYLAGLNRSEPVHSSVTLSASGAMDVDTLPVLCNMALVPLTSPSTPGGATNTRLWAFVRAMTADSIKAATWYWGDPNSKYYQSAYGMITELRLSADATGTDGAMQEFDAIGNTITPLGAVPTLPTNGLGVLLVGSKMQVWIDTSSAIGTTAITGRFMGFDATIPTGVVPKYVATGPTGGVTYSLIGRERTIPEMTLRMDKVDEVQFNNILNADTLKVRVRVNGALIEGALYNYVEVDMYGKPRFGSWTDNAGTNRALEFTIRSQYDATLGSDCRVAVQNDNTTL